MQEYLTTEDISQVLKVDIVTVRRWIKGHKLPALYIGRSYLVKKEDYDKFLKDREGTKEGVGKC